jgi:hypothetical protein
MPNAPHPPSPNPPPKGAVPGSPEAEALALDPLKGNVAFSSAQYGYSFTLASFAGGV